MIHCYKLGGLNIVIDVYSGAVHVVDEVAYDIIEMYESKSREEIVSEILVRYADKEDITKEEIEEAEEELEKVTEASIKDIFARIKDALLKLWAKVKAFFVSVRKFFDALILNGKDFAKKYKNEITNVKEFNYLSLYMLS